MFPPGYTVPVNYSVPEKIEKRNPANVYAVLPTGFKLNQNLTLPVGFNSFITVRLATRLNGLKMSHDSSSTVLTSSQRTTVFVSRVTVMASLIGHGSRSWHLSSSLFSLRLLLTGSMLHDCGHTLIHKNV
jgi:hypothetical protein